ncbi:ATP-binding protein [Eubacterium sp. 1001713B170207_170306_E7]|uniref:sensor histidine kinase n=1 Tax=Eubacterium sp. 1001713B170207_170306_E7 TaxID=2787097 RepID=UPI001898CCB7|nr:ATP-binding protein [Eubacterium sp. 1001713B170207_170306_E7]
MKNHYLNSQLLLMINQLLLTVFLCWEFRLHLDFGADALMPMAVIFLTDLGAVLIQLQNYRSNAFLRRYTLVLVFITWCMLFLRLELRVFADLGLLLYALLPLVLSWFFLNFIFQDSAYTGRRPILYLQLALALLTLVNLPNPRLFNLLLAVQWLFSTGAFGTILLVNRKRSRYFFRQERRSLLISMLLILFPAVFYSLAFRHSPVFLSNTGLYVLIGLPLISVQRILKNSRESAATGRPPVASLSLLALGAAAVLSLLGWFFSLPLIAIFILLHTALCFVLLCYFYTTYQTLSHSGRNTAALYRDPLIWLNREERLKKAFSDYLHDAVLQDLLSVKNLTAKADRPEIRALITSTLDQLNTSIRNEMQEYSPALLRSMTLKENYERLLEGIAETYPLRKVQVQLVCPDDLFLIEPYNRIVFRLIKELVNNAYKHSDAAEISVSLTLKDRCIRLSVLDNGTGFTALPADLFNHKGLVSVSETLTAAGGELRITPNQPSGLCATALLPVKGDISYENFID